MLKRMRPPLKTFQLAYIENSSGESPTRSFTPAIKEQDIKQSGGTVWMQNSFVMFVS
jgi:hypothetical protein